MVLGREAANTVSQQRYILSIVTSLSMVRERDGVPVTLHLVTLRTKRKCNFM